MASAMLACVSLACCLPLARAAEHVSLSNGFDLVCDHRVIDGVKTRLYLTGADNSSFVEVSTSEIASVEPVTLPTAALVFSKGPKTSPAFAANATLTSADLHELLTVAGGARNLDVDLLACVVHAESGGRAHAVSRTGARGLMQLMPQTAAELGVTDSFKPDQNINGGTAYLNALLVRYHDDLALALAAYNAGPRAVDRYHGVPPYRETRAYVAHIIHEFNQRKLAEGNKLRQTDRAASQAPNGTLAHAPQSE